MRERLYSGSRSCSIWSSRLPVSIGSTTIRTAPSRRKVPDIHVPFPEAVFLFPGDNVLHDHRLGGSSLNFRAPDFISHIAVHFERESLQPGCRDTERDRSLHPECLDLLAAGDHFGSGGQDGRIRRVHSRERPEIALTDYLLFKNAIGVAK